MRPQLRITGLDAVDGYFLLDDHVEPGPSCASQRIEQAMSYRSRNVSDHRFVDAEGRNNEYGNCDCAGVDVSDDGRGCPNCP